VLLTHLGKQNAIGIFFKGIAKKFSEIAPEVLGVEQDVVLSPSQHEKQPYSTKQEIDTTIPPKAKPVFNEVSVNGVVIAESDILQEAQNHPAKNPGDALLQAARALVVRELLWQEAKNKGLVPEEDVAGQTQLDAAIANLLDQEVNTPEAREEDCRRLYDRDPSRFSTDTIWEVRHILLAANPEDKKAYEDARIQAEKILSLLKEKPTEFAEIAKNMSACPSAKEGGNLGQITVVVRFLNLKMH